MQLFKVGDNVTIQQDDDEAAEPWTIVSVTSAGNPALVLGLDGIAVESFVTVAARGKEFAAGTLSSWDGHPQAPRLLDSATGATAQDALVGMMANVVARMNRQIVKATFRKGLIISKALDLMRAPEPSIPLVVTTEIKPAFRQLELD